MRAFLTRALAHQPGGELVLRIIETKVRRDEGDAIPVGRFDGIPDRGFRAEYQRQDRVLFGDVGIRQFAEQRCQRTLRIGVAH